MPGYPISPAEFMSDDATAGDAATSAGFVLTGIHDAYDSADKLQNVTGYTRDMAYKQLDAIRMTIEDDLASVPGDPSTEIDGTWYDPLKRDMLMGWQTVQQVRQKANETVSWGDYLTGIVSKAPAAIGKGAADLVAPVAAPLAGFSFAVLLVLAVVVIFVLRTDAASSFFGSLGKVF